MFVSSGSTLIWVGQFASWSFDTLSLDDAVSQVSAYLKNSYNLIVTDYEDTLDSDSGAGAVTLTLQTGMDRGDTDSDDGVSDVKSNVDDAWAHLNTFGYTPPNLTGSSCDLNSMTPSAGGAGPTYSFSVRNLLPSWLGGMPVTPDQNAAYTAAGTAQINSVADNAKRAGYSDEVVQTASTTAGSQSAQFVKDQSSLSTAQNKAAASSDQWILYGLIGAAVLVGVVVALPYIGAARSASGA